MSLILSILKNELLLLLLLLFSFMLFSMIDGLKNDAMCYPNQPQCQFNQPYLLIHNELNEVISWSNAMKECKTKFGEKSTLAYLNPTLPTMSILQQFRSMQQTCSKNNENLLRNCWIGGYRSLEYDKSNNNYRRWDFNDNENNIVFNLYEDKVKNNELYHINDDSFNFWSCDKQKPDKCEPDNNKNEDCLALYSARNYNISDWPCNGGGGNFKITDILCTNPEWNELGSCICDCDVCSIHGDPHIHTLDNLLYHPMGNCSYHYVTPCYYNEYDEFFPFDITGNHEKCFKSDMSCLKSLYISIFDPEYYKQTKNPALLIKVGNTLIINNEDGNDDNNNNNNNYWQTVVEYLKCNNCKYNDREGPIEFDKDIVFYNNPSNPNEPWCFRIIRNSENNNIVFRFYGKSEFEQFRVEFRDITNVPEIGLYLSDAKIYLSQCLKKKSCGLCGYYDGDDGGVNDFVIRVNKNNQNRFDYKGIPDFQHYIDSNNVDNIKDLNAFQRSQDFTEKWTNQYPIFVDRNPKCGPSKICNFDDFADLCPSNCNCIDLDGNLVNIEPNGISDSCTIDFCACINLETDEMDEKYNIELLFGMKSEAILKQIRSSNKPLNEETNNLLIQFLIAIERHHCYDILDKYCCRDVYCVNPLTPMAYCIENPTPVPTKSPTPESIDTTTESPTPSPTGRPSQRPSQRPSLKPIEITRPTPMPTKRPTNTNMPTTIQPTPLNTICEPSDNHNDNDNDNDNEESYNYNYYEEDHETTQEIQRAFWWYSGQPTPPPTMKKTWWTASDD